MTKQLACCIAFLIALSLGAYALVCAPLFLAEKDAILEVKEGGSFNKILSSMDHSQIHSLIPAVLIKFYFYLTGAETRVQAGFYSWPQFFSLYEFKQKMINGAVLHDCFTIIEGSQTKDVLLKLATTNSLSDKGHLTKRWQVYLAALNKPFEGQLLAETYCFKQGESAFALLKRAMDMLDQTLLSLDKRVKSSERHYSVKQRLIIASLLQKESATKEELTLVSSVIYNRLSARMLLQIDSSVLYGLGLQSFGVGVKEKLAIITPYNTYKHKGLPPGPIANVGVDALEAAFFPKSTNFFYFVLEPKSGRHIFSTHYRDHVANIRKSKKETNRNNL